MRKVSEKMKLTGRDYFLGSTAKTLHSEKWERKRTSYLWESERQKALFGKDLSLTGITLEERMSMICLDEWITHLILIFFFILFAKRVKVFLIVV